MNQKATSPHRDDPGVQILAHRGLESAFVPENTIKAFADALAAGADVIETDIQVSKDNVPLIFHDETLLRMAGIDSAISDFDFAELEQVDIGHGKRVATLEQALLAFPSARFNLDIKTDSGVLPTVAVIEKLQAHDRVLFSSFNEKRRLHAISLVSARVRTSAGVSKVLRLFFASLLGSQKLFDLLAKGSDALQIPTHRSFIRLDSPRFIRFCHRAGLEMHYWTINDAKEMKRLVALGADGIVTDHADVAIATLR
jgi:glycerophosphoryl diester phosphodiesterase